jgi:hypothetical protein
MFPDAKFLDVIGTKSSELSSWLFTVTSTYGFTPPRKSGLKLVCNVNIVYGNLNKIVRSCIRLLVVGTEMNVTEDRLLCARNKPNF